MKMRNLFAVVMLSLLTLSACNASREKIIDNNNLLKYDDSVKKQYIIGISFPTTELIFRATMKDIIAREYPKGNTNKRAQVIIYDGMNSQKKQNEDLLSMITSDLDGIVLIPYTTEGSLSLVRYANDKQIPIITVDNGIDEQVDAGVISYVGADHKLMGKQAAELFIDALKEYYPNKEHWNVIQLTGIPGSSGAIERGISIDSTFTNEKRINLLGSFNAEFRADNAKSVIEDCLDIYDDINGVICQNDLMAEGCYEAVKNAGKLGNIVIVGIDGQKSVVDRIGKDGIYGTVIEYPKMIEVGIELLCDYLDGKKIDDVYYQKTDKISPSNVQYYIENNLPW